MPTRFNVDHQTAILDGGVAVHPGGSHEFTDEQVEAGLAGRWSDEDPRAGLKAEQEFKKRRDSRAKTSPSPDETPDETSEGETDPVETGENKE